MTDPRLDPASFAWGLALGATFGSWLRGTLHALFLPRDRDPDWRRSFSHENTNRPSGPPPFKLRRSEPDELFIRMDEGRIQRGNGNGGPTTPKPGITPKPQPAGGHLIIEGRTVRGQPLICPSPATIAECGGPCEWGFVHCDCGLLQKLNPHLKRTPNPPPSKP